MDSNGPKIALAPDIIAEIGGFSLRNTHLTFFLISLVVMIVLVVAASRFSSKPSKFQIVVEGIYNFFYSKIDATTLAPWKKKTLLSIVLTLFIIIIISNIFAIAPILSSITVATGLGDTVPLLRSPTSHFALPIALGLFVVILANVAAIIIAPMRYIGGFIKIGPLFKARTPGAVAMGLLDIFLGFMDLISELAKIVSISARLFGNIIAGEIIAIVMIFLVPYIVPIPFFLISLFAGVIQAFVFALLSMQFIAGSIEGVSKE